MQKAFEKIIKRLEELRQRNGEIEGKDSHSRCMAYRNAIKIVNQVAEEYIPDINARCVAWETIYRRLLEVIDEYAAVGDIVNVTDCKKLSNLLRHYKEQLTEEADSTCSGGWILCDERMPEEKGIDKAFLCCFAWGEVTVCRWQMWADNVYRWVRIDDSCYEAKPVAWQPLPKPYEQKDCKGWRGEYENYI